MLLVTTVVVLVTSAMSLRLLANNRGKMIVANFCEQQDASLRVTGLNPAPAKCFSHEISIKCTTRQLFFNPQFLFKSLEVPGIKPGTSCSKVNNDNH